MAVTKNKNEHLVQSAPTQTQADHLLTGLGQGLRAIGRGTVWVLRRAVTILKWFARLLWGFLKLPVRLLRYLWVGHVPEFDSKQQAEAFWRVKRYYRRRRLFYLHLIIFAVSAVLITGYYVANSSRLILPPLQNYLIGGGLWVALVWLHHRWLRMADAEDEAIAQVIEAGRQAEFEKRKRERIDLLVQALDDDDLEQLRLRLSSDRLAQQDWPSEAEQQSMRRQA